MQQTKDQEQDRQSATPQTSHDAIRSRLASLKRGHRNLDIAVAELAQWQTLGDLHV